MPEPHEPRRRPDPGPMRLAFGVAGVAAVSAITAAIVTPAGPPAPATPVEPASTQVDPGAVAVRHVTRYVYLKPGQTAPPGARVVRQPDPSPRVIVTQLPAPAPRTVVVTTRQSGVP